MSVDDQISNKSNNRPFEKVLEANVSRRKILVGGLAVAATSFFPASTALAGQQEQFRRFPFRRKPGQLVGFTPVPVAEGNGPMPVISDDYEWSVLIPWGTPLQPWGPAFYWPPTAAEQAQQIGIGHDGMTFFPLFRGRSIYNQYHQKRYGNRHGVIAINHEFGRNSHVLGKTLPETLEEVRVSQHAHGVSMVEVQKIYGAWERIASRRNRRIHVNTPVQFSGPVANSDLLANDANNFPAGTVNNCSNGETPWGTYVTCEENFNGYFGATDPSWAPDEFQERYGFTATGFNYGWEKFDERFDLSNPDFANEQHRFGWVVEIDPHNPNKPPVKRTALGRIKHEGAEITVGRRGRLVVYMGDDQRFDYIYKFVSAGNYKRMLRRGVSPLDEGKLYVAKFNDDNTGEWKELTISNPVLAEKFSSQEAVLTYARVAADLLGATPMDRPEWISVAPNQDVYCTLTNNSKRTEAQTDAANPLGPNNDGHIIRWRDSHGHTGTTFTWDIFKIAESTHGTEQSFADPDGIWADPDGRLFIQTDGSQKDGLNNQMLVADTMTGEIRRLFTGVTKDEITGIAYTPDRRTMFINTQHPGNGDPALTNFPAEPDGVTIPRDCTIVITKKDGGIIGS